MSNPPPPYVVQARDTSLAIQGRWIQSVLREAAASVLRNRVLERALQTRRQRDNGSISSIDDDDDDDVADDADCEKQRQEQQDDDDAEVVVTQEDIDSAYQFADRVGREWANCLAMDQPDGTGGVESSSDLVLKIVEAGRFLEENSEMQNSPTGEAAIDGGSNDAAGTSSNNAGSSTQDTPNNAGASLACPHDAITSEVALSRLTTPPALLIGHRPFGKLLDRIPPNPVLSAAVATMVNTNPLDIKNKNEAAERWRHSLSERIDELGRDGKTSWMHPWDVVEKACNYNDKRLESSRTAAITTAEITSGRAIAVGEHIGSGTSGSRKRPRSESVEEEEENTAAAAAPVVPRPPSTYSSQKWTRSDLLLSLSEQERKSLEDDMLHHPPEDEGQQQERRAPSPLPPACIISGHLQHLGFTQLWEKSRISPADVREDDAINNTDVKKARRKRKRMYRKAKAERMGGDRAEKDNGARLDVDKRLSKVVRATEGGGGREEKEDGAEWFELDIGGCLVEVDGHDKKDTMTFRSMEVSLSLDD